MSVHDEINHELDMLMETIDEWVLLCLDCKHAYKRKSDADMLFCRLRKRKCPKKKNKGGREERRMRQDDTYEFIGAWDEQFKRVGFESDFEGRPIERLIRCKDCKWFGKSGCAILIVDESDKPKEDDYCSKAERKRE